MAKYVKFDPDRENLSKLLIIILILVKAAEIYGIKKILLALHPLNLSVNGNYESSRISQLVHGKPYREEDSRSSRS
jgi:hypothetical protein